MQFSYSTIAVLATLLLSVSGSPMPKKSAKSSTTAAAAAAATGATTSSTAATGSTLKVQAYNDFQISSGKAGTAEAQAKALLAPIDTSNLAAVTADQLSIVQGIHDAAEDAEVKAFNPAIKAATGDAATFLQNGKIKNKVLKLSAEVLGLQIKNAQGTDETEKITAEQAKLANNIKLDTAAAGQASTAVPFDASS